MLLKRGQYSSTVYIGYEYYMVHSGFWQKAIAKFGKLYEMLYLQALKGSNTIFNAIETPEIKTVWHLNLHLDFKHTDIS